MSALVKLLILRSRAGQQAICGSSSLSDRLVDLRARLSRAPLLGDAPVHDRPTHGGGGEEPLTTE
jgi:hypothetical protein